MTTQQQNTSMPQNLTGFDLDEGLNRVGGDTRLYKQLLNSFYNKNGQIIQQLEELLQQEDYTSSALLVHSVKGVSGNLSANQLFTAAKQLELELKQPSPSDLSSLTEQFTTALTVVMDSLESFISLDTQQMAENADDHPVNLQTITDTMRELSVLLDEFNIDAEESFRVLQQQLMQNEHKDILIALENAITDLDFEVAAEILNKLANTLNIKL